MRATFTLMFRPTLPIEAYMADFSILSSSHYPPIEGRGEAITFAFVEERLIEAIGYLDRVTPRGGSPFAGDGPWSQIVKDRLVDYVDVNDLRERGARERGGLRAQQVDRMNATLEWITLVPAKGHLRRLIGIVVMMKATGGSQIRWADVRRRLRVSDSVDVLRMSYSRSITRIAKALEAAEKRAGVRQAPECDGAQIKAVRLRG